MAHGSNFSQRSHPLQTCKETGGPRLEDEAIRIYDPRSDMAEMMYDNGSFRRNEDVNAVFIEVGKRELNLLEIVAWNNFNRLPIDFMAVGSECPTVSISTSKGLIQFRLTLGKVILPIMLWHSSLEGQAIFTISTPQLVEPQSPIACKKISHTQFGPRSMLATVSDLA